MLLLQTHIYLSLFANPNLFTQAWLTTSFEGQWSIENAQDEIRDGKSVPFISQHTYSTVQRERERERCVAKKAFSAWSYSFFFLQYLYPQEYFHSQGINFVSYSLVSLKFIFHFPSVVFLWFWTLRSVISISVTFFVFKELIEHRCVKYSRCENDLLITWQVKICGLRLHGNENAKTRTLINSPSDWK